MGNRWIVLALALVLSILPGFSQSSRKLKKILLSEPAQDVEVLRCDRPWEYRLDYASILDIGEKYVMYYRVIQRNGAPWMAYCYAVSEDGLHWEKPDLHLFSYQGDMNNNIISDRYNGIGAEYIDSVYYWLADRTYDEDNKQVRTMSLLSSSDGFHFRKIEDFDVPFFCDTQNQLLNDKYAKRIRWYFRSWYKSQNNKINYNHSHRFYRSVSYFDSEDVSIVLKKSDAPLMLSGKNEPPSISTELPVIMKNNSDADYDIYTPCVHQYRKNFYVAYPTLYYHFPDLKKGGSVENDGKGVIAFWVSKNGRSFKEVKRDYMSNGDNWLEFCVGHVETDKMLIHYYIPFSGSHAGNQEKNAIRARIHYK